jgi:magnesium-transporting ATPase (P-type)
MGFLATYLFSGNSLALNLSFLNNYPWPHLFTISGDLNAVARTVFLTGVVIAQIGNAFACRTSKAHITQMGWGSNRTLLLGVLLSLVIIAGLLYVPQLSRGFDNQVFPSLLWPLLVLYAPVLYTIEWFRKAIIRLHDKKRQHPFTQIERR